MDLFLALVQDSNDRRIIHHNMQAIHRNHIINIHRIRIIMADNIHHNRLIMLVLTMHRHHTVLHRQVQFQVVQPFIRMRETKANVNLVLDLLSVKRFEPKSHGFSFCFRQKSRRTTRRTGKKRRARVATAKEKEFSWKMCRKLKVKAKRWQKQKVFFFFLIEIVRRNKIFKFIVSKMVTALKKLTFWKCCAQKF